MSQAKARISSADRHLDILRQAIAVTDVILATLEEDGLDQLNRLVDERLAILNKLELTSADVRILVSSADRNNDPVARNIARGYSELMAKHHKCTDVLQKRIRECKDAIMDLNRNDLLPAAYSSPTKANTPRFLDNRT